jgi:hypothetical protein
MVGMMLTRTDKPTTRSALPASLTEVSGMFRHIRVSLTELDRLARVANSLEAELQAFLESYYARVLPLTARLERLRYRKEHGVFPNRPLALDLSPPRTHRQHNVLAQRKRALFRKLAKRCHPDNKNMHAPIEIAEVYEAKTISALWLLDIRCTMDALDDNEAMSNYLEQQRAEIGQVIIQARAYNRAFTHSNQWELKERVCSAALEGVDLVEHIQRRIETQIAALQQYFVKPRDFRVAA